MPLTVTLHGELDYSCRMLAAARLCAAVRRSRIVIVNLEQLQFLDCAGLGMIAAARALARSNGGDLILEDPRGIVRRLLTVLDFPFTERKSHEEAEEGAGVQRHPR